jgi:DNA-binding NarL/FixJ family response regulator
VLLGNLEPMMLVGVSRALADAADVVGEAAAPEAIVAHARRLQPDAVVLDLPRGGSRVLCEQVRAAAPAAKVILLAQDESRMEILAPDGSAPRWIDTEVSDALLSELRPREATAERT